MTKSKSIMLWVLAFILMASLAIYQRVTGPTYAVTGTVEINGAEVDYELPRSHGGDGGELISIVLEIWGKSSWKARLCSRGYRFLA